MLTLPLLTDPTSARPASNAFDTAALHLIKDERDLVFIRLMAQVSLVLIPLAVALFVLEPLSPMWWAAAVVHFGMSNFYFKGPFGLMLHCISHRPLYKPQYAWLNYYLTWGLAPLFGHTPESYFSHHIGMHHPENNEDEDGSSTMAYRRDSLRGFLHYYVSFMGLGVINLSAYLKKKNRPKLMYRLWLGEACFYGMCLGLAFANLPATLAVFIIPYGILRLIMMLGNWTQHAFISSDAYGSAFQNSVTCINTGYNHKCFNDGYHSSHHQRPGMHYTEYPGFFLKRLDQFEREQGIVFSGIHYLHVFAYLMTKRYDKLAHHYVNLGGRFETDEQIMAFLKSRTVPIQAQVPLSAGQLVGA